MPSRALAPSGRIASSFILAADHNLKLMYSRPVLLVIGGLGRKGFRADASGGVDRLGHARFQVPGRSVGRG